MVSGVWVRVLCIFLLIVVPEVWATSYPGHFLIITGVTGGIIFILICVCLIICCVAPCCLCYKLCRKQHNQRQIVVNTVANMPQPHYSPYGYQAQPPGYQAVAGYEGSTLPTTPPPSYRESTSPLYSAAFAPWQAMYPLTPPSQPSAPPLPSDEIAQPPYSPIYRPQH